MGVGEGGPASCQGNKSKQTLPPLTGRLACWGACGDDLICPPNPTPKARLKVGGPGLFVLGPDPWKRLGLGVQGCPCGSLSVGGRNTDKRGEENERVKRRGREREREGSRGRRVSQGGAEKRHRAQRGQAWGVESP